MMWAAVRVLLFSALLYVSPRRDGDVRKRRRIAASTMRGGSTEVDYKLIFGRERD